MFEVMGVMLLLLSGSIYDCKYKCIPCWIFGIAGLWAIGSLLFTMTEQGFWPVFTMGTFSTLPGLGLLLLSRLTEKKVGEGDGILLLLIGLMEGVEKVLSVFCVGLFLQAILAAVLLITKKVKKQTAIPFAPFLLAARVIVLFS